MRKKSLRMIVSLMLVLAMILQLEMQPGWGEKVYAAAGVISTVAGNGTRGYSGDGEAATSAQLNAPTGVAVDSSGNLYIADRANFVIRKVDTAGKISTVAGNGTSGHSGEGGPATSAQLDYVFAVTVDSRGNIYLVEKYRVRKVDTAGIITTVAGNGTAGYSGDGGPATTAQLDNAHGVAVDSVGNVYIADAANNRIRKVDTAGIISTIAGSSDAGYSGDGGAAQSAQLSLPHDVEVDHNDQLYIADSGNNRIRKVDATGNINTVAGTGVRGNSGDGGAATSAQLNYPLGIAVDSSGNVYIADSLNFTVRKVDATGNISTVAGTGVRGNSGDGGPATSAQLNYPLGVAADRSGHVYFADIQNERVRKVAPFSTNADLRDLTLSAGTLNPVFLPGTTVYSVSVDSSVSSITVTPTTADSGARVSVNGKMVESGNASDEIVLMEGDNLITVMVTAQDGIQTNRYSVTVTRASAPSSNADLSSLTLSNGTLRPAFAAATTNYSVSVDNDVSSLTVTPTVADSSATVTVNGNMVANGESSGDIELRVGSNDITIVVTSPAMTTKTYTVTVTRAAEITLPTPPPPPPLTLYEQQTMRNEQASAVIRNATDARTVSEQVKQVVDQLSELIESNELSDAEKWDLVTDTVNKVYAAAVAKWEEKVVDHSQLSNSVNALLEQVMQPLLSEMSGEGEASIEKATAALSSLIQTFVAKLDKNQLSDKLTKNLNDAFATFLSRISSVQVEANAEVDQLPEQFDQVGTIIDSFNEQLDDKAFLFNLEKNLTITVLDSAGSVKKTNTNAKAEVSPLVRLSRTVVGELVSEEFGVSIAKREGTGIQLPAKLLAEIGSKQLAVTITKLSEVSLPSNVANESDAYEYTIQAAGETVTDIGKNVVRLMLPYDQSAKHLMPFYYDQERKAWKQLTTAKGKAVEVNKSGKTATFETSQTGSFLMAEAGIQSISVKQKKLTILPNESAQLEVIAKLADRSVADVTEGENGTTYQSSNKKVATVSEDGLVTIAEDAKAGARATITVKNGRKSVKISVVVPRIMSLTVSPKKASVEPGATLQLTVSAGLSDRSKRDVTKGEAGTIYKIAESDAKYAEISEDGLLQVNGATQAGIAITITVEYGGKAVDYKVIITE